MSSGAKDSLHTPSQASTPPADGLRALARIIARTLQTRRMAPGEAVQDQRRTLDEDTAQTEARRENG